jgi:hypothetical protein
MLDTLTRADFDPHLNQSLPLNVGSLPTQATLVEVRALQSPSPRAEPFALTFVLPPEVPVGQGTFCLTHPKLGAIELFMVPVGKDAKGNRYEAIFN